MATHYRSLLTAVGVGTLALASALSGGTTRTQAAASPVLRFVPKSGYRIAIAGSHWGAKQRILFSLKAAGGSTGMTLKSTSTGQFLIGIANIDLCGGSSFRASNIVTRASAKLRGPALMCPNHFPEPKPVVTVLGGTPLPAHEVDIVGTKVQGASDLHVGDVLAVFETANDRPAFTPSVDATYFAPIEQGKQVAPCPPHPGTGTCAALNTTSFYWKWRAVRAGSTLLALSPACRDEVPACGRPDIAVRLHIYLQ